MILYESGITIKESTLGSSQEKNEILTEAKGKARECSQKNSSHYALKVSIGWQMLLQHMLSVTQLVDMGQWPGLQLLASTQLSSRILLSTDLLPSQSYPTQLLVTLSFLLFSQKPWRRLWWSSFMWTPQYLVLEILTALPLKYIRYVSLLFGGRSTVARAINMPYPN